MIGRNNSSDILEPKLDFEAWAKEFVKKTQKGYKKDQRIGRGRETILDVVDICYENLRHMGVETIYKNAYNDKHISVHGKPCKIDSEIPNDPYNSYAEDLAKEGIEYAKQMSNPSEGMYVSDQNGWIFRGANRSFRETEERFSLNVIVDKELIKKLDDFAYKHKDIVNDYKFRNDFRRVHARHDTINMYCCKPIPEELKKELAEIIKPHVRRASTKDGKDPLLDCSTSEPVAYGIVTSKEPNKEMVNGLMRQASEIDEWLFLEMFDRNVRKSDTALSAGEYDVMKRLIEGYEADKDKIDPTSVPSRQNLIIRPLVMYAALDIMPQRNASQLLFKKADHVDTSDKRNYDICIKEAFGEGAFTSFKPADAFAVIGTEEYENYSYRLEKVKKDIGAICESNKFKGFGSDKLLITPKKKSDFKRTEQQLASFGIIAKKRFGSLVIDTSYGYNRLFRDGLVRGCIESGRLLENEKELSPKKFASVAKKMGGDTLNKIKTGMANALIKHKISKKQK